MRRKNESKVNNSKKTCQLTNWTIVLLKDGEVAVQGLHWPKSNGSIWQSTAIISRTSNKTIETINRVYKLKGQINKQSGLQKGIPPKIIDAFCNGFPTNWNIIIKNYWNLCSKTRVDPETYDPFQYLQENIEIPTCSTANKEKSQKQNTENKNYEIDILVTSLLSNSRSLSVYHPPETQSKIGKIVKNNVKNTKIPAESILRDDLKNKNNLDKQAEVSKKLTSTDENQVSSKKEDAFLKPKGPALKSKTKGRAKRTEITETAQSENSSNQKENNSPKRQLRPKKVVNNNCNQLQNEETVSKEVQKEIIKPRNQRVKKVITTNEKSHESKKVKDKNKEKSTKQNTQPIEASPNRRVLRNRTQIPNYCELDVKVSGKGKKIQNSDKLINKALDPKNTQNSSKKTQIKQIKSSENKNITKDQGKKTKSCKTKNSNALTVSHNILQENNSSDKKIEVNSLKSNESKTTVKNTRKCNENKVTKENTKKCDEKKNENNEKKNDNPPAALTAKKGTKKRKQQLINLMEHINEGYEDDFFESTPFKKQCNMLTDDFLEMDLNENQHIQTPVLMKPICEPVSAKKTPTFNTGISPGTLLAQRGDAKIVWKKTNKNLKPKNEEHKVVKHKPCSSNSQKDLKDVFSAEKEESGDESEKDSYFSEED